MVERLLDQAAPHLGLDRVELRRRNLVPASAMPYAAANAMTYDSGEFEAVLDSALDLSDWSGFEQRRLHSATHGRLRGIGVCCFLEVAGGILEEPADLRFHIDGTVSLHMGAQALGQGHQLTYPGLMARRLGIDCSQVRLVAGDSDQTPGIVATVASRSTMMVGSAAVMACDEAIRRGQLMAAHVLEAAPEDVLFDEGVFRVIGTDQSVRLLDLTARLSSMGPLPEGVPTSLDNVTKFASPGMTFPNGCHVCEVEIDPDTGLIQVQRYTAVDDVGVMLNPTVIEGQIMGGVAQGLGQVLGERLHYDDQGQLLTASFMDYPMPRADTIPHMTIAHHSVPCRTNPLGVKGAGESGVAGALPSAINAIMHALSYAGVKKLDLPYTSQRVWHALRQAQQIS
jgi:carbon-monoxide dehydrogenase large subunit